MSQINYEKSSGPSYQTLNFFIRETAGVLNPVLKIDTSNGSVVCNFSTVAPGVYTVTITGGAGVFGFMISGCQKISTLSPCITTIQQFSSTVVDFFVQDHLLGNFVSNWIRLNLTIYVQTT
jgi:hypothetical protein